MRSFIIHHLGSFKMGYSVGFAAGIVSHAATAVAVTLCVVAPFAATIAWVLS